MQTPMQAPVQTAMQVVRQAMHYFRQNSGHPIGFEEMARALGTTEAALEGSFEGIRGMSTAEALLEHRLNRLFGTLSDEPRQGLQRAIHRCGLDQTSDVPDKFEQAFGIAMPLFLITCRRADDDRRFRRLHPDSAALVLPG